MRLQLLADVGRRTAAILSRADLLRTSVQIIQETFHYFMVNVFLADGEDLVLRACTMPEFGPRVGRMRLRIGREGINGWVAGTGEPLSVPDVRRDARYRYELAAEKAVRSELSVPILLKGRVIGVLDAQSQEEAAFNDLDVFTLQTVAGQLAVSLENARLYEELERELAVHRRTEQLLRTLHVAELSMQRAATPEEVFERVGEELGRVGLPCALHVLGADRREVTLAYLNPGIAAAGAPGEGGPEDPGANARLRSPVPLAQNRIFSSIAAGAQAVYDKGGIVAPLRLEDTLLGFLTVLSPEIGVDDIPAMQVFANEIAAAWSKARLVRELRRSLQELERTQEQLVQSQKMEAVGRLAGGVAHDFNNQLTAIIGYAEVLLAALPEGDTRREEVREIMRAGGRAAELTRQLLAFSRRQVLQPTVVDLNGLVSDMRSLLQRLTGENVRLEVQLASQPLNVRADPVQLERVVMNLAVNARDAMPSGGLLEIRTWTEARADPEVGSFHVIQVRDTGTGMSPEVIRRLFEPFFTTKEPGRGTGLGLSTAYGIVRQSGGTITCQSALGEGTTFVIRLPATREVPDKDSAEPERGPAAGTETILVVEDEEQVRSLVQRVLMGAGYAVVAATTGEEGAQVLGQQAVQLVITDLVLPGSMGGLDLARLVVSRHEGTRLLCISGYSEQLVANAAELPGSIPFLQKPFGTADLLRKVRAIMDQGAAVRSPGPRAGESPSGGP